MAYDYWQRADCYPAQRLSLHTIHTNLDAYRDTRSMSVILCLRLLYAPSLLELFQRCSSPRLQPCHRPLEQLRNVVHGGETSYTESLHHVARLPLSSSWDNHADSRSLAQFRPRPLGSCPVLYFCPKCVGSFQRPRCFWIRLPAEIPKTTTPDEFPLQPPVPQSSPGEFRTVHLNVNELDGFKFSELLLFMAVAAVDCLALIVSFFSKVSQCSTGSACGVSRL